MKLGKFIALGVGPGDPDLLTLKAVATLKAADVIAYPESSGETTAYDICKPYCQDKPSLALGFSMDPNPEVRKIKRSQATQALISHLDQGKQVVLITLGDPAIYSSAMYVHEDLTKMGYDTAMVPGIPSFCAAAAALNQPLCEGRETLTILSGRDLGEGGLKEISGNTVIMKSGRSLPKLMDHIAGKGYQGGLVQRVTMAGERVYDLGDLPKDSKDYFSILVVKP